MAKRQRNRKEQLAEVIRESHEQWKRLRKNGGNDPFWTDTNKDGQKVYTTDIVIEEQDFAESKAASQQNNSGNAQNASNNQQAQQPKPQTSPDGFMSADDEGLPFH